MCENLPLKRCIVSDRVPDQTEDFPLFKSSSVHPLSKRFSLTPCQAKRGSSGTRWTIIISTRRCGNSSERVTKTRATWPDSRRRVKIVLARITVRPGCDISFREDLTFRPNFALIDFDSLMLHACVAAVETHTSNPSASHLSAVSHLFSGFYLCTPVFFSLPFESL